MPYMYKRPPPLLGRTNKKQVRKIAKTVYRSLSEKKAYNALIDGGTAVATTWTIRSFLGGAAASGRGIAEGVTETTRTGDKIRLQAIHFTVTIVPLAAMPDLNGSFCRVVVWHNKQANQALPTATQIWNSDSVEELRNNNFRDRISILKDFTHQMVLTGETGGAAFSSGPEFFGTFSIYPKTQVSYTGADGEIDTILKNDYGIAFAADAACCLITVRAQVVYYDN